MLLSIVVPIYNAEKSLQRCLLSIQNQTFSDWECILVNDGSSDSSAAICDEFALYDGRFKTIHQKNLGVGAARNAALRSALGEFVAWVDSDDYCDSTMFEKMVTATLRQFADICICNYWIAFKNCHIPFTFVPKDLSKRQMLIELLKGINMKSFLWNKLFKRSLFDNLKIPEEMELCEDFAVMHHLVLRSSKFAYVGECLYYYVQSDSSVSHSKIFSEKTLLLLREIRNERERLILNFDATLSHYAKIGNAYSDLSLYDVYKDSKSQNIRDIFVKQEENIFKNGFLLLFEKGISSTEKLRSFLKIAAPNLFIFLRFLYHKLIIK